MSTATNDVRNLPLTQLTADPEIQSRSVTNDDVIAEYSQRYAAGVVLPPVDVFFDGTTYRVADGFHRYAAAQLVRLHELPCVIHNGSRRDAILFATGANATHGLRRTNADKRKAVQTLLKDEEWMQWSDRVIAETCGVSHTFVANIRGELATVASCPAATIGADGKKRRRQHSQRPWDSISDAAIREACERTFKTWRAYRRAHPGFSRVDFFAAMSVAKEQIFGPVEEAR